MSRRTVKAFGKDEEEEDLRLCLLGTTVLFLSLRFLYKRKGQTQRDRSTEKDETFKVAFEYLLRVPSQKKEKRRKKSTSKKKKKKTNTTPTTTTETEELTKTLLFLSLFSTFCPIFR